MVDFRVTRFECVPGARIDDREIAEICREELSEESRKPYVVRTAFTHPGIIGREYYFVEEVPLPKRSSIFERILKWLRPGG